MRTTHGEIFLALLIVAGCGKMSLPDLSDVGGTGDLSGNDSVTVTGGGEGLAETGTGSDPGTKPPVPPKTAANDDNPLRPPDDNGKPTGISSFEDPVVPEKTCLNVTPASGLQVTLVDIDWAAQMGTLRGITTFFDPELWHGLYWGPFNIETGTFDVLSAADVGTFPDRVITYGVVVGATIVIAAYKNDEANSCNFIELKVTIPALDVPGGCGRSGTRTIDCGSDLSQSN
jgi:hypothetical protein